MYKKYNLDLESQQKPQKTESSAVKNVVNDLLKTYQLEKKFGELEIVDAWQKVMGELVSKRTQKVYIKADKMFVKIESATLKNELLMRKSQIIKDLNAKVGQEMIQQLIFL
jgi:predicted nucleic acid-binding Zn ribbon protein